MATTSLFPLSCYCSLFSSNFRSNHHEPKKFISMVSTSVSSNLSLCNSINYLRRGRKQRFQHLMRTSSEGVPSELAEDPKFVPLNPDDPVYGPPALLLMGFEADETDKIQKFLKELDGEFLKVIHCTEDMLNKSIWDAMNKEQPNLEAVKIAESLPRICFLSGLSGEEMMMFIDAFPETGLKPALFAALVPNSANKPLLEVAEEIMGDHEMMVSIATTDEVMVVIFFDRVTRVLFGCSADEFFHFCRLHPFAAEKAAEMLEGEMCRITLSKPKSSNAQHLRAASVVPLRTGFRPVIDTLKQMYGIGTSSSNMKKEK